MSRLPVRATILALILPSFNSNTNTWKPKIRSRAKSVVASRQLLRPLVQRELQMEVQVGQKMQTPCSHTWSRRASGPAATRAAPHNLQRSSFALLRPNTGPSYPSQPRILCHARLVMAYCRELSGMGSDTASPCATHRFLSERIKRARARGLTPAALLMRYPTREVSLHSYPK